MKLKFFLSLRWRCFLLALGMFPESSEAEIHTPGLDARATGWGGTARGTCQLTSKPGWVCSAASLRFYKGGRCWVGNKGVATQG